MCQNLANVGKIRCLVMFFEQVGDSYDILFTFVCLPNQKLHLLKQG